MEESYEPDMEFHSKTPPQQSEEQKENKSKIRIKLYRKKKSKASASSSSTQNYCGECDFSFNSTKALFGPSMIHHKSNMGAKEKIFLGLREAKHADVMAACILMGIRRSMCETDIDDAKRSKLNWICSKIEKQMKKRKEVVPSVLAAVGAAKVEMHRCDKCGEVFNSGQAFGRAQACTLYRASIVPSVKQRKFVGSCGGGGLDGSRLRP